MRPLRVRPSAVYVTIVLGAIGVAALVFLAPDRRDALSSEAPSLPITDTTFQQRCSGCHEVGDLTDADSALYLFERARMSADEWAEAARVNARCGGCHARPDPSDLPRRWWPQTVSKMGTISEIYRDRPAHSPVENPPLLTDRDLQDIAHYFGALAPAYEEIRLSPDPRGSSASPFSPSAVGFVPESDTTRPRVANVQVVDLDRDDDPEILVSDWARHAVTLIDRSGPDSSWTEEEIVSVPFPGRSAAADLNGDGRIDLAVPNLGRAEPTDERVGGVYLALDDGDGTFERSRLLSNVGRTADVRAGDLDGDGDQDLVVAAFGFYTSGEISWLEQRSDGSWDYHGLSHVEGAVHVPVADLENDGDLDIVALVSQANEEIRVLRNVGGGTFESETVYRAPKPTFGSSGIQLTDLDGDEDLDVLYTNGDAYDRSPAVSLPIHGVQWLENEGELEFSYHDLLRMYGTYRAVAADFDRDGDQDVVAASLTNRWRDPDRKSVVWLENDGDATFTARGVARAPNYVSSAATGDLNGDGRPDVVTGHMFAPYTGQTASEQHMRLGRVTIWTNTGNDRASMTVD